ncbi:MAG: YfhO family protein, partial [Candidatus Rokuibacteriota bacterium]
MRDRLDRFIAPALLVLPLIVFAPALLPGRTLAPAANLFTLYPWSALARGPVPANPALSDVTHVFHPWLIWAVREIHAGRFPFWNPHEYTGTPFFSNTVTALLFPPHWLALVLPVPLAITLIAALKLAVAGLATYWCLRVLALHPLAALPGALGFMLSSTMIGWLHWPYGSTMIFLPLLFGLVERLRQGAGRGAVAALALTLGLDLVAGYPQGPLHGALAAGAWALVRARGAPRRFLARCAAGALLGGALAAVQLLPFWDYVRESAVYAYRTQWTLTLSVPPRAAITFLMPWFFGAGGDAWGPWQFAIVSTWFGIVPVLALPLALLAAFRHTATRFFAVLLLMLLALHYGAPGVVVLAELPGLALGTNLRLMPLIGFALCTLGALGLDAIARGEGATRPWLSRALRVWTLALVVAALAWVVGLGDEPGARALTLPLALQYLGLLGLLAVGAVLLLGWLADPEKRPGWGWALTLLQLASLLPVAMTYNPVADARWLYPSTPAIAALQRASADRGRVLMPGNYGLLYGLDEAHGYDAMTPRRIAELVGTVGTGFALGQGLAENPILLHGSEPLAPAAVLLSPALDLLGVRRVVMPPGAGAPRPDMTLEYDGRDARVWRNERAFPRAFLASRARCADDGDALALVRGRVLMPGNYGLLYGLDEAHGYDAMTPRRVAELVGSVGTGVALG